MTKKSVCHDLYDRFLILNKEAFDARLFSAAYHALASALECAANIESDEPLLQISRLALEQLDWIDHNDPDYKHSSLSSSRRRQESIFYLLSRQAEARLAIRQDNHNLRYQYLCESEE